MYTPERINYFIIIIIIKRCHSTGPGTKEAPGEEMAPRNTSAAGNPPLSENHRTLYTQGSLSLVNKLVVHMSKTLKII